MAKNLGGLNSPVSISQGGTGAIDAATALSNLGAPSDTTTITINGTAAEIASSAGAQDLSANRTWTLSLPNALTFTGKTITGGAYASASATLFTFTTGTIGTAVTGVTQAPSTNNTTIATTEYVDAAVAGGGGAPTTATYITQTPDAGLSAEQALSLLATGILKSTTATGVISIAAQGTDYYEPGGTDVALADGGTGASLVASNGGIFYSTGASGAILAGTATANQMLQSGASAAPAWSTATWPATTTINQILYSSAANTVVGLATANSSVLVTSGGGVPSLSTDLPNGITATTQSAADNSTKVATTAYVDAAAGGSIPFTNVTGTSQAMVANNAYQANNGGLVTLTLPTTAAIGTLIFINGLGAGGWTIAQNASQLIHIGSSVSTTGVGGSISSTNRYDCVTLRCAVADLEWVAISGWGNLTNV